MFRLKSFAVILASFAGSAAMSQHMWFNDPGQSGDILMMRIFVDRTAPMTYYEALGWNQGGLAGGYTGIQDNGNGKRSFIFSIWDPSGTNPINSARYVKPGGTIGQRFGGEGTGFQIFNRAQSGPVWELDQLYTIATRVWDVGPRTMAAAWLFDEPANRWTLEGIHDVPANFRFEYGAMSFLENYGGAVPDQWRRMFTGGGFKRLVNGVWFPLNEADYSGPATNANAGTLQQYFYMETGSSVTNTVGTNAHLQCLPFGTEPTLPVGTVSSAQALLDHRDGKVWVEWQPDGASAPQFSYEIQLSSRSDFTGPTTISATSIAPEARSASLPSSTFDNEVVFGRIRITDLLDRPSAWKTFIAVRNLVGTNTYLTDIPWTSSSNGWGPVERDRSNGEAGTGDGGTIRLNGVTYSRGIGCHANSEIKVPLNGVYKWFMSDVGIDDEIAGIGGSSIFQVFLDGVKAYDSSIMNGSTTTQRVLLNVSGVTEMRLVTTDAGDGNGQDHTDWADARLIASTDLAAFTITPTSLPGGHLKAQGRVVVDRAGLPASTVYLSASGPEISVPSSILIFAGTASKLFDIGTAAVTNSVTRTVTATLAPATRTATLTVTPYQLTTFTLTPSGVVSGNAATGTVTINGGAPPGGTVVTLTDNSAALITPATVTIPAGQTTATFQVMTTVTSVQIMRQVSATLSNSKMTRNLIVLLPDLTSIHAFPQSVRGGQMATGELRANGTAGNGFVVDLTSSGPQLIVPSSVTFTYGHSTAAFNINTLPVTGTFTRYITAKRNGRTRTVTMTIFR